MLAEIRKQDDGEEEEGNFLKAPSLDLHLIEHNRRIWTYPKIDSKFQQELLLLQLDEENDLEKLQ